MTEAETDVRYILDFLLNDKNSTIRSKGLEFISSNSARFTPYLDLVVAKFDDSDSDVRSEALEVIGNLEPAAIAKYADSVETKLEDSDWNVRYSAINTIGNLEPATLAKYADSVAARLEDSCHCVRTIALEVMCKFEPATIAQHADAVVARLGGYYNEFGYLSRTECLEAVHALRKLDPATLTQYTQKVIDSLRRVEPDREGNVWRDYQRLHPFIANLMMGIQGISPDRVRARLRWLQLRALFRAQKLAQWWLAYTYAPGRPGHIRELEEFGDFAKRQKLQHSGL